MLVSYIGDSAWETDHISSILTPKAYFFKIMTRVITIS
jgi:hypothetical protein